MGKNRLYIVLAVLVGAVGVAGAILANTNVKAETASANAAVIVPASCNFEGKPSSAHNAEIPASQYQDDIGETYLRVTCNDNGGFAIYAIGYSDNTFGNNKLIATLGGELSPTYDIATGTAKSGATSNWAMKLTASDGTHVPTVVSPYGDYAAVPDTYTKVASYTSATDSTIGATVGVTYAAYIAGSQPAGNYNGKVKFTMVHPASEVPAQPQTTASGKICYYANASDAVGTMGCQNVASSVTLLASNFSRTGYGFAGWSDAFDYQTNENAHFYGPQETIILTPADYQSPNNGLSLYAVWIKSAGNLQDTNKVAELCGTGANALATAPTDGTANLDSVSALTDQRDNQTYAIAKLADGKCWMIENLRLEADNTRTAEKQALAQGYGASTTYGNFSGLADAESTNFSNSTTANSIYYSGTQEGTASIDIGTSNDPAYRMPRYNNWNNQSTSANRPQNPTSNSATNSTTKAGMYSYGNYYTWRAAIADLTYNGTNNQSTTGTSLCPIGWHLPTGGSAYASGSTSGVNVTGDTSTFHEFYNLGYKTMDEVKTAYEDTPNNGYAYYSSNTTNTAGKTATAAIRSFPNNFLYSGYFNTSSAYGRGSYGNYWSSTASNNYNSYGLFLDSSRVSLGTNSNYKYNGSSIRCTVSAGS